MLLATYVGDVQVDGAVTVRDELIVNGANYSSLCSQNLDVNVTCYVTNPLDHLPGCCNCPSYVCDSPDPANVYLCVGGSSCVGPFTNRSSLQCTILTNASDTSLLFSYNFTEGSGTTVHDLMGRSDITLRGDVQWVDSGLNLSTGVVGALDNDIIISAIDSVAEKTLTLEFVFTPEAVPSSDVKDGGSFTSLIDLAVMRTILTVNTSCPINLVQDDLTNPDAPGLAPGQEYFAFYQAGSSLYFTIRFSSILLPGSTYLLEDVLTVGKPTHIIWVVDFPNARMDQVYVDSCLTLAAQAGGTSSPSPGDFESFLIRDAVLECVNTPEPYMTFFNMDPRWDLDTFNPSSYDPVVWESDRALGILHEFRMWERVLTREEILERNFCFTPDA